MVHLLVILTPLVLLVGFFALVQYETRQGIRFFASSRMRFDQNVERIAFILTHVDFGAFLLDETHRLATRVGHDAAHFSLLVVRAAERLLTRAVRYLRMQHTVDAVPRESMREYVKTLSDFKDGLKATHPEISDIQ